MPGQSEVLETLLLGSARAAPRPLSSLRLSRLSFGFTCKQVEPGGTRQVVGLQPTVIASRAPHLLLEQSVRFKESWTCIARQPGKRLCCLGAGEPRPGKEPRCFICLTLSDPYTVAQQVRFFFDFF